MTIFSIILPIYNVERYVAQCIKSILKQSYADFELICVNDCTQDNSMQIIEKFAQHDSRVKIINLEKNMGLGHARNIGIKNAVGKYLLCVDSDDWIETFSLQKIYDAFNNSDTDSVWFKYLRYDEDYGLACFDYDNNIFLHTTEQNLTIEPSYIFMYAGYAWNKVYKLENVKKYDMKWLEGAYFEDNYFYVDYFAAFPKIYVLNEFLYFYRKRKGSIVSFADEKKIADIFYSLSKTYELILLRNYSSNYLKSLKMYANNIYNKLSKTQGEQFSTTIEKSYQKFLKKTV